MTGSFERLKRFNLGWYRGDIATAESYLIYVLVPDWLGSFHGTVELERISASGYLERAVSAASADLASPRRPAEPEGIPLLLEQRLIRAIQVRATRARNTLPEIVPSTTGRGWAKLELTDRQRRQLLRAAGIEP